MKINHLETSKEYMASLSWTDEDLRTAKDFLIEWDQRDKSFYKGKSRDSINFDMCQKQHFINCIDFWEKKLKEQNENQSPRCPR